MMGELTAWTRLRDTLARQRARLLQHPFAEHPMLRAQGLYFLQSAEVSAFNMYVAPRQQYPALYTNAFFTPFELSWGTPNPDFLNHNGFIDGAHSYRIHGNKKGAYWATLQVFRGFWADEEQGTLAHIDFDEVPQDEQGNFEILLGPTPPARDSGLVWVKTDADAHNMMLAIRETFYDWQREVPMEFHIETLDRDPGAPIYFSARELDARTEKARKFTEYNFDLALAQSAPYIEGAPRNVFTGTEGAGQHGGNPLATYMTMLYDIAEDEAVILEMRPVPARYWGFQMSSVWGQTTDYSYHQSSLSGAQARLDADGMFRAVIALQDPGVPNWLDPAGVPIGFTNLRFYKSEGSNLPATRLVKCTELRQHLPRDTPHVTPEERRRTLDIRRRHSLQRYGQ